MKIVKYIKYMDTFGTPYILQFNPQDKYKKSVLGGIISLLVYSASLAYLIYIIEEWISGNLLPKSTSIRSASNYSEFNFENENLFEFSYWKYDEQFIDPFQEQQNILMPIAIQFIDGIPQQPISLLNTNANLSTYGSKLIQYENLTIVQNANFDKTKTLTSEILLMIIKCDSNLLQQGQSCASSEMIQQFFNQAVQYISFWINFQQYDPISQELKAIKKQIYFPINQDNQLQGQLLLQTTQAWIDRNILFSSNDRMQYINDGQIIVSQQNLSFWETLLHKDAYFSLFLRLDPLMTEMHVTYPKIGEVLAQVGSIVSVLLSIRILVEYYNRKLLDQQQIEDVISIYFPDFHLWTKIERELFMKEHSATALQKLLLQNIIFEISRLQFFIQNRYGRNSLKSTINMGIPKLNPVFRSVDSRKSDESEKIDILKREDFTLLCYPYGPIKVCQAKVHHQEQRECEYLF